ncbi:hypothetical protein Tco_1465672 [Tanacetum coccineum]
MRTRSQSRNSNRQQQQVPPTFVELFDLEEPINNQDPPDPPVVTMADNRTMAQLLQAPTEGYEDVIVVPAITADNFELKHGLLTLVQNKQFFGLDKEDPHAHIRYFNKFTSTMSSRTVRVNQPPAYQAPAPQTQVVDFDAYPRVPLILGRSFLKTGHALIDVYEGELTLRVGKEAVNIQSLSTSRHSIDLDPFTPPNQGNYLPEIRKELKVCEAKTDKSLIDEPLEVKLKDLPPHLEYAFWKVRQVAVINCFKA